MQSFKLQYDFDDDTLEVTTLTVEYSFIGSLLGIDRIIDQDGIEFTPDARMMECIVEQCWKEYGKWRKEMEGVWEMA